MRFWTLPGKICFSSSRPGADATMFGPFDANLPPCPENNSFNDEKRLYTWAFFWFMPFMPGQKFTFATGDYDVTCEVVKVDEDFKIAEIGSKVEREQPSKRPIRLAPSVPPPHVIEPPPSKSKQSTRSAKP